MRSGRLSEWIAAGALGLVLAAGAWCLSATARAAEAEAEKTSDTAAPQFDNAVCLGCHGNEGFSAPGPDGKERSLHVIADKFEKSVHAKRLCVECHKDITEIPHKPGTGRKISCVQCHETLWAQAQKENKTEEHARLGVVVEQIEKYMKSVHARPNKEDQSRTNATCYNCHDAHYIFAPGTPGRAEWRLNIPNVCGKCHVEQRKAYEKSVHGDEVLYKKNPKAAVCSDCHTTHDIDSPKKDASKLVITKNCGTCHQDSFATYTSTYHGQVNVLGYAYTAKCFNCHGSHDIQRTDDPKAHVHPNNRLQTCQQCHTNASRGFLTFEPHGNTHDFSRYPQMWVTARFMLLLLAGVFAFFWFHSAVWFYREYKERQERKSRPHVQVSELPQMEGKQFRRFGSLWRLAHLLFAISVMTLVLTGMAVFYAETEWAQALMRLLGGPKVAAVIHRASATVMLGIFFIHLVYMVGHLWRIRDRFDWFGPDSLVPNWKDLEDMIGMFKWALGKGPKPLFDRWTYWEKFDYWAVFWGMIVIGGSGMMLAFPIQTATFLPGWVFNVATLVHGEEAFLAAVFLFTVHFFNNHFRPEKFPPPDVVMFTGSVDLDEFRHEHPLHYQRLAASGELEKYLVEAPSEPMTLGSKLLGLGLIAFGLLLLVLVVIGFTGNGVAGH